MSIIRIDITACVSIIRLVKELLSFIICSGVMAIPFSESSCDDPSAMLHCSIGGILQHLALRRHFADKGWTKLEITHARTNL